jgi:Bacterial type II and III secretion system protein/FG-GAP-like repeat
MTSRGAARLVRLRVVTFVTSLLLVALVAGPSPARSQQQRSGAPPEQGPASSQSLPASRTPAPQERVPIIPPVKPDAKKAKQAYQDGIHAELKEDWEAAFTSYSDATNFAPENRDYLLRREMARSRLVQAKMNAAEREADIGRLDQARQELLAARYLDPTNTVVKERFTELSAIDTGEIQMKPEPDLAGQVHLNYQPGVASFDYRGDTEGAYEQLANRFGVEVAFDVDLRSRSVRFQVDAVDFPTAARLLGEMTGTFWRPLTKRLFFVTDDTPQKRRDYDVSVVRTILLPASETPDQMTETLRLVREIAGITRSELDPNSHTLTLRASPQAIAVASDLVSQVEQPVGEMILEIEILEVDRDYARQLGITPPQTSQTFTFTPQQIQEAEQSTEGLLDVITQVFGVSSLSALPPLVAFGGGDTTMLATMPGAAANFSEMLSLVRQGQRVLLRAQDRQPASFFLGERFPVSLAQYSASQLPGSTTGTTGAPFTNYAVGNSPAFVATASLRNNGINDLITANLAANTVSVLLGNGDGTFATQVPYATGTGPVSIATGLFQGGLTSVNSEYIDLAVADKTANTVSILLGNGDGTFQPKTDIPTGHAPVSVVAANFHDLTSSTEVDLAVANQEDNSIWIFQGNGNGTFNSTPTVIQLPSGFAPASLATSDLNSDGHTDLVVVDQGNNSVSVLLGNGNGTFQARTDYPTGDSPVYVALGEFNDDGAMDIAVADNASNAVTIYFNQTNSQDEPTGTFVAGSPRDFAAGRGPTAIAVADYSNGGVADLAVSDQTDNAVSILLNLGSGTFSTNYELPVGTAPASVTTADFNGDGLPDLATANYGAADVTVILTSSSLLGGLLGSASEATPFPGVEYIDIGLKVKATPRIHPDGDVTLQLSIEASSLSSESFNTIPVINSDSVQQTVRVKENQTAILAAFMESQVMKAINGTPGIAEIPGLGLAASNQGLQNQSDEILFLITPRMVRLAPRKDRTIYAGRGSLEGTAGATAGSFGAMRELPAGVQPTPTEEQSPQGQPGQQPPPPGAPPNAPPAGAVIRTSPPPGETGQAAGQQATPNQTPPQP